MPKSILFVCIGNTCRSLMAEYFARRRYPHNVFASAGVRPQPKDNTQRTVEMLLVRYDIDATQHVPRQVTPEMLNEFDLVVALDKGVADEVSRMANREILLRNVADPWDSEDQSTYVQCARSIKTALDSLGLE